MKPPPNTTTKELYNWPSSVYICHIKYLYWHYCYSWLKKSFVVVTSAFILSADAFLLIFISFINNTFMFYIWGELRSRWWIICDLGARSASSCTQKWRHGLTSTCGPVVWLMTLCLIRITQTTDFHLFLCWNLVLTKSFLCYELSSMSNSAFGCRQASLMLCSRMHGKFQGGTYMAWQKHKQACSNV